MNILVTGSKGQLGNEIKAESVHFPDYRFFFTDLPDLDITDSGAVAANIIQNSIDLIINCAAYTAVDKAESDRETAYAVNVTGPLKLALAAREAGIALLHISTDYIFNGEKKAPYTETDIPNPLNYYGLTKFEGEQAVIGTGVRSIIIRTSWLYSIYGHNFVKTILRLASNSPQLRIVSDQFGCPTNAGDLAKAVLRVISRPIEKTGEIYHYSNLGEASWFEFASEIVKLSNLHCDILPITTSEYPLPAQRAAYTVMDKTKIINDFRLTIPEWKESLSRCVSVLLQDRSAR